MEKINVTIHINPGNVSPLLLEDFNQARDGKILSDENQINVNRATDGYSVIYEDQLFNEIDKAKFLAQLIKIFNTNLPGRIVNIRIQYNFEAEETYEFTEETFDSVMSLRNLCMSIVETRRVPNMSYEDTESISECIEFYEDNYEDGEDGSSNEFEETDNSVSSYSEDDDPYGIMSLLRSGYTDDDDDDDYRSKKKCKDYYGRSRVWKNAKSPKKAVRRHGVIIADSKSDIKKDEKILKEFLKDFFPGKASWEKEFREDVVKRFIKMYTVSKKNLKKLEKQHRKHRRKKHSSHIDAEKAADITKRLFNVPVDRWNDPTK